MVCSQGISFDVTAEGKYFTLCRAKRLTYITTAGGSIPQEDLAFRYIRKLAETFWEIPDIRYYKADRLDVKGTDVSAVMQAARDAMLKSDR